MDPLQGLEGRVDPLAGLEERIMRGVMGAMREILDSVQSGAHPLPRGDSVQSGAPPLPEVFVQTLLALLHLYLLGQER